MEGNPLYSVSSDSNVNPYPPAQNPLAESSRIDFDQLSGFYGQVKLTQYPTLNHYLYNLFQLSLFPYTQPITLPSGPPFRNSDCLERTKILALHLLFFYFQPSCGSRSQGLSDLHLRTVQVLQMELEALCFGGILHASLSLVHRNSFSSYTSY